MDGNRIKALVDIEEYGHSLRGSVDWNNHRPKSFTPFSCHSLRGSVDWNLNMKIREIYHYSHSLRGSVDWNLRTYARINGRSRSLPTRECGLKFLIRHPLISANTVTPYAGVWIEICVITHFAKNTDRHSLRGSVDWNWRHCSPSDVFCVTPYAGVWIEIVWTGLFFLHFRSLPTRECGLKYCEI